MNTNGQAVMAGARNFSVQRQGKLPLPPAGRKLIDVVRDALPFTGDKTIDRYRRRNLVNIFRGLWRILMARLIRIPHMYGAVYATITRGDGRIEDLGLISLRVVTDTGVGFIVDAFQNSVELENMKYHGFGTGTNAEAAANTTLQTELTTQYFSDNTRPTGSTTEGASANIYRTVGTLDPDNDVAITEHGIFSQAATGGGVLLDRSVFSAINLSGAGGDTLQVTYDLTFASGS